MLCLWRVTAICADGTCCLELQAAFLHLLSNSSAPCSIPVPLLLILRVGRAERLDCPVPIRHSLPSLWGWGSRKANYTHFWQVLHLQNVKQTSKTRKGNPQCCLALKSEGKINSHKSPLSLSAIQSLQDSWRPRPAQQQVCLADVITSLSDTSPNLLKNNKTG